MQVGPSKHGDGHPGGTAVSQSQTNPHGVIAAVEHVGKEWFNKGKMRWVGI